MDPELFLLGADSLPGSQAAQGIPSVCIWRLGLSGRKTAGAREGMLMTGLRVPGFGQAWGQERGPDPEARGHVLSKPALSLEASGEAGAGEGALALC